MRIAMADIGAMGCLFAGRLSALVSLMTNEEATQMVERMLEESEDLLIDTPYLRRIRERGLAEGMAKGLRAAILSVVLRRFNPPASAYLQVSKQLEGLTNPETLEKLLAAAIEAADADAFMSTLKEALPET